MRQSEEHAGDGELWIDRRGWPYENLLKYFNNKHTAPGACKHDVQEDLSTQVADVRVNEKDEQ